MYPNANALTLMLVGIAYVFGVALNASRRKGVPLLPYILLTGPMRVMILGIALYSPSLEGHVCGIAFLMVTCFDVRLWIGAFGLVLATLTLSLWGAA